MQQRSCQSKKSFKILFGIMLLSFLIHSDKCIAQSNLPVFQQSGHSNWADSVLNKLTPEEKIAQLFMVAAYSNKGKRHVKEIKKLIKNYHIGGLIFFQGGPIRQAKLTNDYQKLSKVPLMIAIDGEWGLAMRLDSTTSFPRQMALGAIQNDSLIYQMGAEIARQCKRLGIQVNFAPVVDINSNPNNPVIGNRAFGEERSMVTRKSLMYMKGLQDNGVLATAKHFPGHGDTDGDSHKTLPTINHNRQQLDSIDIFPFKALMEQGLGSIMVAHLNVPALDTGKIAPATLSYPIVHGLLKGELQFKGLVFTDALNMKGVSKYFSPGLVDLKALKAGNDILLFADSVPAAIREIKNAINNGELSWEDIDSRCKKLLLAKQWLGLNQVHPINTLNLNNDLNPNQVVSLNRRLVEKSLTVIQNKGDLIPLKSLDTFRLATLTMDKPVPQIFQQTMSKYAPVTHFYFDRREGQSNADSLIKLLSQYKIIVLNLFNMVSLSNIQQSLISHLIDTSHVIVNFAGNPYQIAKMPYLNKAATIIVSYEPSVEVQKCVPQLIFGAIGADGKLPVTISDKYKFGLGLDIASLGRLQYGIPEDLGLKSTAFAKIDSIVNLAMKDKVFPGCQIWVAKDGVVIYDKQFGYSTYDRHNPVKWDDIYDLASVTKIAASTPAIMKLVESKQINLDDSLGTYLPSLVGSNKSGLMVREILSHQAGLRDWIPFWMHTVRKNKYIPGLYNSFQSDSFAIQVASKLFLRSSFIDTIYKEITQSEIKGRGHYKYSDLGYYYFKKMIEDNTGMPLQVYLPKNFYRPLGLSTMCYNPLHQFPISRIIPTENDVLFRHQLVQGFVHDQGAAMLGGVAGHAGLFSNANDLGILMQMFMQGGTYGGMRYIDSAVVREFSTCHFCKNNRRALGFDKPDLDNLKDNPVCDCVSPRSYGHTGFTGTMTWVDPDKKIVYVFLSNRVNPNAEPNKLAKQGIRTKIQKVIYGALNTKQ